MLNEDEEEAIKNLKDFKSISILYGNTFTMFLDQLEKYQEATNTVLNCITKLQNKIYEKDDIIEHLENELGILQDEIEFLIRKEFKKWDIYKKILEKYL